MPFWLLTHNFRKLSQNCSGGIATLSALVIGVLACIAGFVVDAGHLYYQKRHLQTAADLAAIAAVANPRNASDAAEASLDQHGYSPSTMQVLDFGSYTGSLSIDPKARFLRGGKPQNAAHIELKKEVSLFMAPVMAMFAGSQGGRSIGQAEIKTRATAAMEHRAAFSVGSRLLALDNGILNSVLGGLYGSGISLSVMDYEALVSSKIDFFSLSDALNRSGNLSSPTYKDLGERTFTLSDIISAASALSNSVTGPILRSMSLGLSTSKRELMLKELFLPGPYESHVPGQSPSLSIMASALEFAVLSAQTASNHSHLQIKLAASLPPLISSSVQVVIGERPVETAALVVGAPGSTAHTAQTRALFNFEIAGVGDLLRISLPIYVEIASATARLKDISCPNGDSNLARITVAALPAIASIWIGDVSKADLENTRYAPSPSPAKLASVGNLVKITGIAKVTLSNLREKDLVFSASDVWNGNRKTVSTTESVSSLTDSLIRGIKIDTQGLLPLLQDPKMTEPILSILASAAPAIDHILNKTLATLGVSIGQAEVAVSKVLCGAADLVR
ncbi:MAG: pilus assembly protein TadG-related protein [Beijerinckiaceae bacterium]|nr:pilus assembly protein TadG-related protein [Beijerinckiaceae bacterium]